MKKNPKSVVLKLDINEEQEKFDLNYSGDLVKIVCMMATSIAFVFKKSGYSELPDIKLQELSGKLSSLIIEQIKS